MIYCYDMSLYYFAVGIVLSWNMTLNETPHADIASYQLFAYQEGTSTPSTTLWKKVGISSQSKKGNLIQRASQTNTCTFNQFVPLSDIRQLFFEWVFVFVVGWGCEGVASTHGLYFDTVSGGEQVPLCCPPRGCTGA